MTRRGTCTSWTHPAGFTITNTYNAALQLTQMGSSINDSSHPGTLATMTYGPSGALKTLLNGCAPSGSCTQIQETYDYNTRLQAVRLQLGTASNNSANYCLVYNYYSGSNPTSCAIPASGSSNDGNVRGYRYQDSTTASFNHTATYTYDSLNRLVSAAAAPFSPGTVSYNQSYNYTSDTSNGRYGNMACSLGSSPQCAQPSFDSLTNRIYQINGVTASYDAAGDLTNDGTYTYQYDGEGRLVGVAGPATRSYTYNPLGQIVQDTGTNKVFDPNGRWMGFVNGSGSFWAQPVPFASRPLAMYLNSAVYLNHINALGSTTMNTTGNGAWSEDLLYYPWGQEWTYAGTLGEHHFASFESEDWTTAIDPTLVRPYKATHGRWLSPDPLAGDITNPQSLNRYAYVMNNPTSSTDPLGLGDAGQACGSFEAQFGWFNCVGAGGGGGGGGGGEAGGGGSIPPDLCIDDPFPDRTCGIPPLPGINGGGGGGPWGPWGESLGIPYGLNIPPPSIFPTIPGPSGCDFGNCSPTFAGGNGFLSPDDIELHHVFPQQFAPFWNQARILFNNYLIPLTAAAHRLLPNGIHTNAGGNWNKVWQQWIEEHPNATPQQIFNQAKQMLQQFGIGAGNVLGDYIIIVDPCVISPQQFSFCRGQVY